MKIGGEFSDVEKIVYSFKDCCDGIVLNPDHVKKLFRYFLGRHAPALIVQVKSSVVPPRPDEASTIFYPLIKDAISVGASAVIGSFFVGHEKDEDEAGNVRFISFLARESEKIGLPLIVECIPFGERVTRENFPRCVELAARVSTEAGADIVAIPYVGEPAILQKIIDGVGTPVLMLDIATPFGSAVENFKLALNCGASGLVIGGETFQRVDIQSIKKLYELIHVRDIG
ncbi:hypothetical protein KEJ27_05115 [Candidatus Bathyarchaeota archaeon]|nr:hypothetical protein [Candidatus Bathyarchaeota archaeon]